MIAYLVSNNGKLKSDSGLLVYSDYLGNITKFIPNKVSQFIIIGKIELTGSAINTIMNHKIFVNFIHRNGKFNGKLIFDDSKNTFLRHKQHQIYDDYECSLSLAKDIVRGKIHNELFFAQRILRNLNNKNELLITVHQIKKCLDKVNCVNNISELRGIEGEAAKAYFNVFGCNFKINWTKFVERSKNPPLNEINSVLSFLYTLLAIRIDSLIISNGLDDSIGTLHALSYGRKSLIFDLIEEYRTPIADTLTCSLFNLGTLKKEDFRTGEKYEDIDIDEAEKLLQVDDDVKTGVYLTDIGMKKVATAFEKKIRDQHFYPELNKTLEYDKIFNQQIILYKSVISGNRNHYLPMVIK